MSSNPAFMGNPFYPVIDNREIRKIILYQGVSLIHKSKDLDEKCEDGWDERTGFHDPECPTCNSKSGYSFIVRPIKAIIQQQNAHALYNSEDQFTKAGFNERSDLVAYTYFSFQTMRIKKNDIIILRRTHGQEDIEYVVQAKKPFYGSRGKIVGYRMILWIPPVVDTVDELKGART